MNPTRHFSLLGLLLTATSAFAAEPIPGEIQATFGSPNQLTESCALPRALDLLRTRSTNTAAYIPFRETEMKTANKICRADFYDTRESNDSETAVVTCPKLNSTNPGLMFHELPNGMSRDAFIKNECSKDGKRAGDLIAKFKQSVSCSYTPSILSYPRIAKMLQSEIELPFTAYRSMDLREHLKIATVAKDLAARVAGHDSLIAQTWRRLYNADLNPEAAGKVLYRDGFTQIYGALVPELKNDAIYYPANGSTRGDRVANFQVTAAFQRVTSPSPVADWGLGKTFSTDTAQKLLLLREMGDLIILDTLLNQQDRFGNLHHRQHYVKMNADGSLDWQLTKLVKNSAGKKVPDTSQASELLGKGYLAVSRMLLVDNDCGVAKENKMAEARIAQRITHLHPDSYSAIQNMQHLAETGVLAQYLKQDLLFTNSDVKSVQANLALLASTFKRKCLNGTLFLDADLAQWLGKKPVVDSKVFCSLHG